MPDGSIPTAYLKLGTIAAATYRSAKKTGAGGGLVTWINGAEAMAAVSLAEPSYRSPCVK